MFYSKSKPPSVWHFVFNMFATVYLNNFNVLTFFYVFYLSLMSLLMFEINISDLIWDYRLRLCHLWRGLHIRALIFPKPTVTWFQGSWNLVSFCAVSNPYDKLDLHKVHKNVSTYQYLVEDISYLSLTIGSCTPLSSQKSPSDFSKGLDHTCGVVIYNLIT